MTGWRVESGVKVPLRGGLNFAVHLLLLGAPTGELASIASLRGLLCCTLTAFAFTPSRTLLIPVGNGLDRSEKQAALNAPRCAAPPPNEEAQTR